MAGNPYNVLLLAPLYFQFKTAIGTDMSCSLCSVADSHFGILRRKANTCFRGVFTHHGDVILGERASQITSLTIVYSTVNSDADQRKHKKLGVTGLCAGNSPGTGDFPAQMASNAENVSIWWRHRMIRLMVILRTQIGQCVSQQLSSVIFKSLGGRSKDSQSVLSTSIGPSPLYHIFVIAFTYTYVTTL